MITIRTNGLPIVKSKDFCPNPVSRYGVPEFADSESFPDVIGTEAWREWWEDQVYYCLNGYWTGGLWIPGRYYYYLNFFPISTLERGIHKPEFVDVDYEFFLLVEKAKREKKGIICVKARRKGLSFKAASILSYGMRFYENDYRAGICGSLEAYATAFYKKFKTAESLSPQELRLNKLHTKDDECMAGYKLKTDQGFLEAGSRNTILVRTMYADTNVFKGEQLNDCIFEEAGENSKLESCYGATRECFRAFGKMTGTPYVYGTGDKMENSEDFLKMWEEHDKHDLLRFWVSRRKIYAPAYSGAINPETRKEDPDTPYLEAAYPEPWMRVGMQDEKRAEELFQREMKALLEGGDRKAFVEFTQNNPGNIKEAFQSFSENNYDTDLLMQRNLKLMNSDDQYEEFVLEYVKDKNGAPVSPRRVYARYAQTDERKPNYDQPWKRVKIKKGCQPNKDYLRMYVAGLDGYNQDESKTSSSLGAMEVYAVQPEFNLNVEADCPHAIYYSRPPRKEIFFEICLKLSIYYSLLQDVLADAGSDAVIGYFKDHGGEKYLAKRPKAFESDNSKQTHVYGAKFVGEFRNLVEGLCQTDLFDNIHKWSFRELVSDHLGYNQEKKNDNDCDLHDAHGLALVQKSVRKVRPINIHHQAITAGETDLNAAYVDDDGNVQYKENRPAPVAASKLDQEIGRLGRWSE